MRGAKSSYGPTLVAAALFGLVFVARWSAVGVADAVSLLYAIPVALLATRFGLVGGLGAAGVAMGLTGLWNVARHIGLGPWGYGTRFSVFLMVGAVVGLLAERVGKGMEERQRLLGITEKVRRSGDQARRLQVFLSVLSRAATQRQVAQAYTSEGLRVLSAARGGVFILDEEARALRLLAVRRPVDAIEDWLVVPLDSPTPLADAVHACAPIYCRNIKEIVATYPDLVAVRESSGDQAWAMLPLVGARGIIGAMSAAYPTPQSFDEEQREVFELVAQRLADAVERARLLEVADRQRARAEASERRTSLLADVGAVLTAASASDERMQSLVNLLVSQFADFATVETVDGYSLQLLAAAHTAPEMVQPLRQERAQHPVDRDDSWGLVRAIRQSRGRLVSLSPWADTPDEGHIPGLRPVSVLAVPLIARGTTIGGMLVGRTRPDRRFDEADLALANLIAGRAALALDNAQLYERQRNVVLTLQHALLPAELPKTPGVTSTAYYQAGQAALDVGGDWYDLIVLPGDRVGVVLGDVVGSGVQAAATMGRLRSAVAALAPYVGGPADLLRRVDDFAASVEGARLATMVYADFDPATGMLRYSCRRAPAATADRPWTPGVSAGRGPGCPTCHRGGVLAVPGRGPHRGLRRTGLLLRWPAGAAGNGRGLPAAGTDGRCWRTGRG